MIKLLPALTTMLALMSAAAAQPSSLVAVTYAESAISKSGPSVVAASAPAAALLPPSYSLSWWTLDGGGGPLQNGTRRLDASIGQPDANPGAALLNGARELRPGYWTPGAVTAADSLFADGFE